MRATARLAGAFGGGGRIPGNIVFDAHDPATSELPFHLEIDRALFLENVERACPELEPENVSFPGQQVVVHIQSRHRLQMAANDALGNEMRDLRGLIAAMLDVVQRSGAYLQAVLVDVVPLRDARVEIPAVIIEASGIGDATNVVEVLALELSEPDDDIGNLNARVVD